MFSFFTRWPGWAIGVVALIGLGVIGSLGYVYSKPARVTVSTVAKPCSTQTQTLASLFSDDQTTMIRLSNPDFSGMRILRTEPANVLPGLFDALLSLSADGSRLAYITAADELLNDARVDFIDVANPGIRIELAKVPSGLWVVKPAWSPDHTKLAWVRLSSTAGQTGQFQLWVADTRTQPATVAQQADLVADNFTNGHSASICWTADNRVVLLPNTPTVLPSPTPTPGRPTPTPSPSPVTGSPCGVPIFSQNDPGWRDQIMQAGSDSVGGYGCALTSAAMMLNYFGATLTPAQLSTCLGAGADPIAWKAVPTCTKGLITGGDRIDFTWPDLDNLLGSGRPAIVGMLRGLTGSHFVVVTSGGGGLAENYHITDPWDATTFKTLGSYINAGYNPHWIISYSGAGQNCARLISGGTPSITGITDGGTTKGPVTINPAPTVNLKNLKSLGILKLSPGTIVTDTFGELLPFQKLVPNTTISDEGIYEVQVITQVLPQPPHVELYRFTIDKTPPVVDLALLNLLKPASGTLQAHLPRRGAAISSGASVSASTYPLIDKPGKVRIVTSDNLSGVSDTKYSLDGGALVQYSSDTSFNKVLTVAKSGDHSLKIQSIDAAGNVREATKYFTVFGYVPPPPPPPSPTPLPTPPPPQCTLGVSFAATPIGTTMQDGQHINLDWVIQGNCPPFAGRIDGFYQGAPGTPPKTWSISITGRASPITDVVFNCNVGLPLVQIRYTITVDDGVRSATKTVVTPPVNICS